MKTLDMCVPGKGNRMCKSANTPICTEPSKKTLFQRGVQEWGVFQKHPGSLQGFEMKFKWLVLFIIF